MPIFAGNAPKIFRRSGPDDTGRSSRFGIGHRFFDPGSGSDCIQINFLFNLILQTSQDNLIDSAVVKLKNPGAQY